MCEITLNLLAVASLDLQTELSMADHIPKEKYLKINF